MSFDIDDSELQLALELSRLTYNEEEKRRNASDEVNLIQFESPEEIEQRQKINHIKRINQSSFDQATSLPPSYGWNPLTIAATSRPSISSSFSQFPPNPTFSSWHTFDSPASPPVASPQSILPPPLPPRMNSLVRRSNSSGNLNTFNFEPPPPLPPRTGRIVDWREVVNPLSPGLDNSGSSGLGSTSFLSTSSSVLNRNPSHDSSFTVVPPHANPGSQYDYLNADLYVPYAPMSREFKNGDLIDFDSPDRDGWLEEILQEFDVNYPFSFGANNKVPTISPSPLDVSSVPPGDIGLSVPAIKIRERARRDSDNKENEQKPSVTLVDFSFLRCTPSPLQQISIVKQRGLKKATNASLHFKAFCADYSTTSAQSIKVVIYTDYTWPVAKEFPMTVDTEKTTPEMITTELLVDLLPEHMLADGVPAQQYGLKVFGLDEFLPPDAPLGHNVYVGKCQLHLKDIKLEIGPLDSGKQVKAAIPSTSWEQKKPMIKSTSVIDVEDVQNLTKTLADTMADYERDFPTTSILSVSASTNKVKQTVKMLCRLFNSIVPFDLYDNLQKYLTATSDNQLRDFREKFLISLHTFISTYCKSTMSMHRLRPLNMKKGDVEVPKEVKEILNCKQNLKVIINSVHNLPADWMRDYSEFFVTVNVYHGTRQIDGHDRCVGKTLRTDSFFPYVPIDVCISFNHQLCLCPRETKIMFVLHGVSHNPTPSSSGDQAAETKKTLAFASMPLFDYDMIMRQGTHYISLTILKDSVLKPWGAHPLIANEKDPIVIISLPTYNYNVVFPDVEVEFQSVKQDFFNLSLTMQSYLMDIIEAGEVHKLSLDEQEVLWQERAYLMDHPDALPLVLASVNDWGYAFLPNVYQILEDWATLPPVLAMQLLLPQYPDERVRKKAVGCILRASSDFLFNALPQLVEALRFELYENSALAIALLTLSYTDRRFAFEIYWQLQQRIDHCVDFAYAQRCSLLQKELLERHEADHLSNEIAYQHDLLNSLDELQMDLRNEDSDSARLHLLRERLGTMDSRLLQNNIRLPIMPSFKCSGIAVSECNIFNSNAKPLKLIFRGLSATYPVIHKNGDDMRQDALVLQLVGLMNDIWLEEALDLRIILFRIMPVGYRKGMAELVSDCATLCDIQKETGMTGVFKDDVLFNWIKKHNSSPFDYQHALDNFTRSCAGWCVATYILGIGDRHNDNILVTTAGHVFHIDFGKYMGDWQTAAGFKRDRVPFVFTAEMCYVINGGTEQRENYQNFIDYCCRAFNCLRRKYTVVTNVLKIMACSDIAGMDMDSLAFVEKNLMLELSETDAVIQFTELINASLKSAFPRINFFFHTLAQMISGNSGRHDQNILSFVPQLYSKEDDGKITNVQMISYEKRMIPHKVYMYKVKVSRESENVSTFVYRTFEEFSELYVKLRRRFPQIVFPALSGGTSKMRSMVREVAQRRMIDLQHFLQYLFSLHSEISHCDLVYTFFHLILRDSNIDLYSTMESTQAEARSQCVVHLRIEFSSARRRLSILVGHVKHLSPLSNGQLPEAYVKTYIRPDTQNLSKRKTQVAKASLSPTFNKELVYDLRLENPDTVLSTRVLEVSVWNCGGLMDNHKMYMVYLPLQKLKNQCEDRKGNRVLEGWYSCERVST